MDRDGSRTVLPALAQIRLRPNSSALWTIGLTGVRILVEAAGVEPASEKVYREKTTCVSDSVFFDRSIRTGKREAA